ncbi:Putative membrane lipoprotein, partial [Prunus dulcis]
FFYTFLLGDVGKNKEAKTIPTMEQKTLLPALLCIIFFNLLRFTLAQKPPACQTTCGSLNSNIPLAQALAVAPNFPTLHSLRNYQQGPKAAAAAPPHHHTASYPITSISYSTQTLTLTPPSMSSCSSMQPSPSNFGLDWASPFQLGRSTFILLSCPPPTSSLTSETPPASRAPGIPPWCPLETTDGPLPVGVWVALKYSHGDLDSGIVDTKCKSCEMSDGVCGYSVDDHSFLCGCKNGYNTSSDCNNNFSPDQELFWGSASNLLPAWKMWFALVVFWEISYSCFDLF